MIYYLNSFFQHISQKEDGKGNLKVAILKHDFYQFLTNKSHSFLSQDAPSCSTLLLFKIKPQRGINIHHIGQLGLFFTIK